MIRFIGKTFAFLIVAAVLGGFLTLLRFAAIGAGHPLNDNFMAGFFFAMLINTVVDIYKSEKF